MTDRVRGPIVWFTGLPASGKSTLAQSLRLTLEARWPVEILDGDEVRGVVVGRPWFLLAPIATATSPASPGVALPAGPQWRGRAGCRRLALCGRTSAARPATAKPSPSSKCLSARPWLSPPSATPRNVPASARRPDCDFTGLSDSYEEPEYPDLVIHSDAESSRRAATRVVTSLLARGWCELPISRREHRDTEAGEKERVRIGRNPILPFLLRLHVLGAISANS